MRLLAMLLLVGVLGAGQAHAFIPALLAYQTVLPGQSIQDAVDQAAPNGTIVIVGYHSEENIYVDSAHTGLKIIGGKNAVIDGESTVTTSAVSHRNGSFILEIAADNVVVQGITFINADEHIIVSSHTNILIKGNAFYNAYNTSISGSSDKVYILSNTFAGNYDVIDVESWDYESGPSAATTPNILVQGNVIQGALYGVYVGSDDGWIVGNLVQDVAAGSGIYQYGNFGRVTGNVVSACGDPYDAFSQFGPSPNSVGSRCKKADPGTYAAIVSVNPSEGTSLISFNQVQNTMIGIAVLGTIDGSPTVVSNVVMRTFGLDTYYGGIVVDTDSSAASRKRKRRSSSGIATVQKNTAVNSMGFGLIVFAGDSTISGNYVQNTLGICVQGDFNAITANTSVTSYFVGLEVEGFSNVLTSDVVNGCVDGIEVFGSANKVAKCAVANATGEALQNQGSQTTVTGSSFSSTKNAVSNDTNNGASFLLYSGNIPLGVASGPGTGSSPWPLPKINPEISPE